jgi:hypothetical protein
MDFVDTVPGALQRAFDMAQADGREHRCEAFVESISTLAPNLGQADMRWLHQGASAACQRSFPLRRLMQRKFGPLPAVVQAAIGAASLEQLDRWLDRILVADTAEDTIRD